MLRFGAQERGSVRESSGLPRLGWRNSWVPVKAPHHGRNFSLPEVLVKQASLMPKSGRGRFEGAGYQGWPSPTETDGDSRTLSNQSGAKAGINT